jgi:hypothetical protein
MRRRYLLVPVAALVLWGCASGALPPARSLDKVNELAGRWEGMANVRRQVMMWRVSITPEGGLTIQYGATTLWGVVRVAGGVARWDASTMAGRLTLYGEGPDRILEMVDDWGSLYVRMAPGK